MNGTRTNRRNVKRKTRFELIDKDGCPVARAYEVAVLAESAEVYLPGQQQDEERTGKGWDIQVVGLDV